VALSLFAIQQIKTGIASTLMSLVPVFIIWPSAIMFNEKIKPQQIIGAVISIIGVSLFFFKNHTFSSVRSSEVYQILNI